MFEKNYETAATGMRQGVTQLKPTSVDSDAWTPGYCIAKHVQHLSAPKIATYALATGAAP